MKSRCSCCPQAGEPTLQGQNGAQAKRTPPGSTLAGRQKVRCELAPPAEQMQRNLTPGQKENGRRTQPTPLTAEGNPNGEFASFIQQLDPPEAPELCLEGDRREDLKGTMNGAANGF